MDIGRSYAAIKYNFEISVFRFDQYFEIVYGLCLGYGYYPNNVLNLV